MVVRISEMIFSSELLIDKFQLAENDDFISNHLVGFKTLFKSASFSRIGIHQPKKPKKNRLLYVNGSGVKMSHKSLSSWASSDENKRKYAQINHYMVQSVSDYLLKSARGSTSQLDRGIGLKYWAQNNINHAADTAITYWSEKVWEKMSQLDISSRNKLFSMRKKAIQIREKQFKGLLQDPYYHSLYRKISNGS